MSVVWLLGGLDPTGGAGLLRDFATARAFGPSLRTRSVVTAFTMQGHGGPARARAVSVDELRFQLNEGPDPAAIKIGLVPRELVDEVVAFVDRHRVPVVVDPVMVASDGGALGSDPDALRPLLERATLVTPNRDEAARLELRGAVLHKNVGDDPNLVVDVLVEGAARHRFERPRNTGPDPRGTGCALATAIACGLALGDDLHDAVANAIAWLDHARAHTLALGSDGHQLSPSTRRPARSC
jgi:hydroxymethylpyrimidine/phosphomethylpyrimidine kinase